MLSGTLSQLVSYTGFARRAVLGGRGRRAVRAAPPRRRDAARPFSAIGYPWAPALFVAASAVMLANEVWRNPVPTLTGAALIVAGVPVYY